MINALKWICGTCGSLMITQKNTRWRHSTVTSCASTPYLLRPAWSARKSDFVPYKAGGNPKMATVVVGCGLMGSALVRALARAGNRVVAWNRTAERAEVLAGGAVAAERDIVTAVAESRLVIVCTSTYEAGRSALDPVEDFGGRGVVNLSTGTPISAEEFRGWVEKRGGLYLDGAINYYPASIGAAETKILYAGDPAVWAEHKPTLLGLGGGSQHISPSVSTPNVLAVAMFGGFYFAALAAYVEASAYAQDQGVTTANLALIRDEVAELLHSEMKRTDEAIEAGRYETDQATLDVFADGGRSLLEALRAAGYPARLLDAACQNIRDAQAAGLGKLGFQAQARILKSSEK